MNQWPNYQSTRQTSACSVAWERTWLSPITVVTIAAPSPVVTLTLSPPIKLQTRMYHIMFLLPYLERESVRSGERGEGIMTWARNRK